jgi:hypothetical protein
MVLAAFLKMLQAPNVPATRHVHGDETLAITKTENAVFNHRDVRRVLPSNGKGVEDVQCLGPSSEFILVGILEGSELGHKLKNISGAQAQPSQQGWRQQVNQLSIAGKSATVPTFVPHNAAANATHENSTENSVSGRQM